MITEAQQDLDELLDSEMGECLRLEGFYPFMRWMQLEAGRVEELEKAVSNSSV